MKTIRLLTWLSAFVIQKAVADAKPLMIFMVLIIFLSVPILSSGQNTFPNTTVIGVNNGGMASFAIPVDGLECIDGNPILSLAIDGGFSIFGPSTLTITGPGIPGGSPPITALNRCGVGIQLGSIPLTEDISCLASGSLEYEVTFSNPGTLINPNCAFVDITLGYQYFPFEAPQLTGMIPPPVTGLDACAVVLEVRQAINAVRNRTQERNLIEAAFTDNCGNVNVTNGTQGFVAPSDDCSWTYRRSYNVVDDCGNAATVVDIFHSGGNVQPPKGGPIPAVTGIDECAANAVTANPFDMATALLLYTDFCDGVLVAANIENVTASAVNGDDCTWDFDWTFDVVDDCGNRLDGETYNVSGGNLQPPKGGPIPDVTGIDECAANAVAANPFDMATALLLYTDFCDGVLVAANIENVTASVVNGDDCTWDFDWTFDVVDDCGNRLDGETYNVAGADITPPTITPPTITSLTVCNTSTDCNQSLDLTLATATDNCTPSNLMLIDNITTDNANLNTVLAASLIFPLALPPSGMVNLDFPIGTTMVTITLEDQCGNAALTSTVYTVTVYDCTAPTINACPSTLAPIIVGTGSDGGYDCQAVAGWANPTAADNCPNPTITGFSFADGSGGTNTPVSFPSITAGGTGVGNPQSAVFQKGVTEVTITVSSGNTFGGIIGIPPTPTGGPLTSTCTFTVTINDDEVPTIVNALPATVDYMTSTGADCPTDVFMSQFPPGPSGPIVPITIPVGGPIVFDVSAAQDGSVTYTTLTHADFDDNCDVNDGTLQITALSSNNDACTEVVTIEYTYTDCGGNAPIVQSQTVNFIDDTAPTGTAPTGLANVNQCAPADQAAADALFSATIATYSDNCNTISIMNVVSTLAGGDCGWTVTHTYDVEDACGNSLPQSYIDSGSDQSAPSGTAPVGSTLTSLPDLDACAADAINALTADGAFNPANILTAYTDNCVTLDATSIINGVPALTVNNDCGWTVTYTYDVTDGCVSSLDLIGEVITFTGRDQTPPTGPAQTNISGTDACLADVQAGSAGAFDMVKALAGYTDNCGQPVIVNNLISVIDPLSTDCAWTITHSFTIDDDCGNPTATLSYTESGSNQTPLVITAPQADFTGANVLFTVPTDCNRNAAIQIPVINDACGNAVPQTANPLTIPPALPLPGWTITSDDTNLSFVDNGTFWDGDFRVGITTVTITGTDLCGNQVTDDIIVEVIDNIAPSIVSGGFAIQCPGPVVNLTANSNTCDLSYSWDDPGFTDNCDIPGGTITFTNGIPTISGPFSATGGTTRTETFPLGTTTVTYTVFDNASPVPNQAVLCQFDVVVVDGVAPTAVCPPLPDVSLDASGNGSIAANIGTGLSTDNCSGIIPIETSPAANFTCADLGPQIVVLTATDSDGNIGTANCSFEVKDLMAPTASCQDVTIMLDANGNAATTAMDINNGTTDNCDGTVISGTMMPLGNSFDCTKIGPNPVTVTFTDNSGNISTCTATVTVVDDVDPVAVCPATVPTVTLGANGNIALPATLGDGSSTDNCGTATEINTTIGFNCMDIGVTTTYDLTATDGSGNTNTVACNVNIVDMSGPVFTCVSPIVDFTTSTDCNVTIRIPIPGVTDNCTAIPSGSAAFVTGLPVQTDASMPPVPISPITISNLSIVNGDTEWQAEFPLGITYLTLTSQDAAGNPTSCTFSVTVEDLTSPNAVCAPITVALDASGMGSININQFTSGDNCGVASATIVPSSFTCSDIGSTTATLTVTDDDGNVSSCTSAITITDNIAPTMTLTGNAVEFFNCGGAAYVDAGAVVTDNCDSGLTPIVTGGPVDLSTPGSYTLFYNVSDASGNAAAQLTRTVIVNDPLGGYAGGAITGDGTVCAGQNGYVYSIPSPPLGSTVTWSHSLGTAVFAAGQGTGSVTVNFPDDLSLADGYCVIDDNGSNGGFIQVEILGGCSPIVITIPITYLDDELCSIYNCFVDLHVNDALALSAAASPTLYQAGRRLSSDGTVQSGRVVDYTAGRCIELKPGFEVELSARFLADIVPCVSQAFTAQEADVLIDALEKDGIKLDRELLNINDNE